MKRLSLKNFLTKLKKFQEQEPQEEEEGELQDQDRMMNIMKVLEDKDLEITLLQAAENIISILEMKDTMMNILFHPTVETEEKLKATKN